VERREFFSSFTRPFRREERRTPIYPPYFHSREDFERCLDCSDKSCEKVCEEGIIEIVDGIPILNFSRSGCTFCDECARACELAVLKVEEKRFLPAMVIDPIECLAWHGTICSSCRDACLDRAIEFVGLFRPEIKGNCTGCGFCVGVCPTGAISVGRVE